MSKLRLVDMTNTIVKSKLVLAYGELLWDLLPNGRVLGGATANFSCRVAGLGLPTCLLTSLGNDDLGREAYKLMQEHHIDLSLLQWQNLYPTGTVVVDFTSPKDPQFTINSEVAYDHISLQQELQQKAQECNVFYYGTVIQRAPVSRATLYALLEVATRATKILDVNLRADCFTQETVRAALQYADIVKVDQHEAGAIAKLLDWPVKSPREFVQHIIEKYDLQACIVTMGECGVFAGSGSGEEVYIPGYHVPIIDVIGGGGAFIAAFVYRYLEGGDLEKCCRFGNLIAAMAVTRRGGISPLSWEEIDLFSRANFKRICNPDFEHSLKVGNY